MGQRLPRGVRAPVQARAQETLERLLDAGEAVIAERGLDACTVSEIVRRARSSVGVFYARFADREALLRCLHERFCEQATRGFESAFASERWERAPAAQIVRAAVTGLVAAEQARPALVRAFVQAAGRDPSYGRRARASIDGSVARLQELLAARREEIAHPDPRAAIELAVWLVIAHLDQRAVWGATPPGPRRLSGAARADALCDVVLRYLGIDDGRGRAGDAPGRRRAAPPSRRAAPSRRAPARRAPARARRSRRADEGDQR